MDNCFDLRDLNLDQEESVGKSYVTVPLNTVMQCNGKYAELQAGEST
jgi:hypothetical protein